MKIDVNGPVLSQLAPDRGAKKVSDSGPASAQSPTGDRTTLHSGDTSVHALTAQALSFQAVRQDKVNALSQSVRSGEYQADAKKTATAIIESGDI